MVWTIIAIFADGIEEIERIEEIEGIEEIERDREKLTKNNHD